MLKRGLLSYVMCKSRSDLGQGDKVQVVKKKHFSLSTLDKRIDKKMIGCWRLWKVLSKSGISVEVKDWEFPITVWREDDEPGFQSVNFQVLEKRLNADVLEESGDTLEHALPVPHHYLTRVILLLPVAHKFSRKIKHIKDSVNLLFPMASS